MMRKAINENRTLQLVLLGALALVGVFLLVGSSGGGGGSSSGSSTPAATPTTPAAMGTVGSSTPTAPVAGVSIPASTPTTNASTPSVASGTGTATVPANLVPGPGLPRGLLPAYHHGKGIVLLVRRAGGIDDAMVHGSVDRLRDLSRVKVYVTRAQHIARYAWLTQGVDVSQLPALVILLPKGITHGTPKAMVSYGFRSSNSVYQAVKDALYRGPENQPYHP